MRSNFFRFLISILFLFVFILSSSISRANETLSFTPLEDSYVSSANSGGNYGTSTNLTTSNYYSYDTRQAYLKFDLSSLAGKIITEATLVLTPNLDRTVNKEVRIVNSESWNETAITWNNKPASGNIVGSLSTQPVNTGSSININLDASVLNQFVGNTLSLMVNNTSVNQSTFQVNSRESTSGHPILRITTTSSVLPGDANADGKVNELDYAIWLSNYHPPTSPSTSGPSVGDFNYDGQVDGVDYAIWLNNYNTSLPTSTPTPILTPTPTPNRTPTPSPTRTPVAPPSPTSTSTPYPPGTAYRAFTSDSWWNVPMPTNAPIDPHNAEYINDANTRSSPNFIRLSGAPGHTDDWAYPVYWAKTTDKLYTVDGINGPTVNIRIPSGATPMAGSDGGIIIYDIAADQVVEFYQATYNSSTDTWGATTTKRYILSSNGLEWGVTGSNNSLNTGHRGQPPSERLIRRDEVASGHVQHRLECFWHDTGTKYANHYWPMSGDEGAKGGIVPEGIVIRLKWSVNVNDPIYQLSPAEKIIAKALQEYGCVIGDNEGGSVNSIKLERGISAWSNLDPEMYYTALNVFTWDKFEFIQGGYDPVSGTIKN